MKVSFQWLRALAPDLAEAPEAAAARLTALGFPVESIEVLSEGLEDLRVGRVRSVRPHPNADRLRVCEVEDGEGILQVVCGAPNVEAGGCYPLAPVGSVLPGGMRIGEAKLRGERSQGMLCSERELGLGPGVDGLLVLPAELEPGTPLVRALGLDDVRLDVEVTSNRPDLLSHEGVAREIAPGGHGALDLPRIPGGTEAAAKALRGLPRREGEGSVHGEPVSVRIEAPELCSRYLGLVLRGVRVGPSPAWLRHRIRAAGGRPINNVVDATNYVLLELGQPLHAFDLTRIEGSEVVVRTAGEGERILTLDGVERTLAPGMLAICDTKRPIAVAGVIGGADSEVGEASTDLLLECALFTPGPIRATRKALGLSTDASYRFEHGVDPEGMERALLRAAEIILATAGGEAVGPIVDARVGSFERTRIALRPDRVERVLGVPFGPERIRDLLGPLGFEVVVEDGILQVSVPGFRSHDVTREVDLIEEIARTHGYDAFPETLRPFRPSAVPDHPAFALEERLRTLLVGAGLFEAQTPAFAPKGEGEVALQNPLTVEEACLRSELLPGLVRRLELNLSRGNRDVRLFEIGTTFRAGRPGELPLEETRVAVVLHGLRAPRHWSGEGEALDAWDARGLLERIVSLVHGPGAVRIEGAATEGPDGLEPGRTFQARTGDGRPIGVAGPLAPGRADLPPWAGEVWGIEVALPEVPEAPDAVRHEPVPLHPGSDRDLALLLPSGVQVGSVIEGVRESAGDLLREVGVFDVYRDDAMPSGVRSVAIRLRFQAPDRTLTDGEVEAAVRGITRHLSERLDVGIRGSEPR